MLLSPRESNKHHNRRNLFTPETALSALPALQINTVSPSENIAEGLKRYKEQTSQRVKLDKERIKINSPLKFSTPAENIPPKTSPKLPVETVQKPKKGQLDISLSSRADECSEIFTNSRNNALGHKSKPVGKQTVYISKDKEKVPQKKNWKELSHNISQFSGRNLSKIYATQYIQRSPKPLPQPVSPKNPVLVPTIEEEEKAYRSRNAFLCATKPYRTTGKAFGSHRRRQKRQTPDNNSTFSTVSVDREKERQTLRVTLGNDLHMRTITNNPLMNDRARNLMMTDGFQLNF